MQYDFGTIDTANTDGGELATLLETYRDAVNSNHSGSARPSYAVQNMLWIDTSSVPYVLKLFNGTDDVVVGYLNASDKYANMRSRHMNANKSASYAAVVDTDHGMTFSVDASAAARAITLPLASLAFNGYEVTVIKTDSSANAVTGIRSGSDTISEFGYTSFVLADQGEWITLRCDGVSKWKVVARGGNDVQQTEAEAGTKTGVRFWSPVRVKQAIRKIGGRELFQEGSLSGVNNFVITGLQIYRKVEIELFDITLDAVTQLVAQLSEDGVTYFTSGYVGYVEGLVVRVGGTSGDGYALTTQQAIDLNHSSWNVTPGGGYGGYSGLISLWNTHTNTPTRLESIIHCHHSTTPYSARHTVYVGTHHTKAYHTSIKFRGNSTPNISAGQYRAFGYLA
jgi:hypothetical protein